MLYRFKPWRPHNTMINYDHYYSDMLVCVSSITCCTEVTVLTTGPRSWTWRAGSGLGVTWLHPLPPSPSRPQHLTVSVTYNSMSFWACVPYLGFCIFFLKVKLSQLFLFPWCFQWKICLNWTSSDKHHLLACSPTGATERISVRSKRHITWLVVYSVWGKKRHFFVT